MATLSERRPVGMDAADPAELTVEDALRCLLDAELVALRSVTQGQPALHLLLAAQFATARTLRLLGGHGELRSVGPSAPDGAGEVPGPAAAAVDLLRLADCVPVGLLAEVEGAGSDGDFWRRHGVGVLAVEAVAAYRLLEDAAVERVVAVSLPTPAGEFRALGYRTSLCDREYVVLVRGELADLDPTNVHLHFGCLHGDVFRSRACPCGARLARTMESVAAEGGAIVYLPRAIDCAERGADAAAGAVSQVDRRVARLILRDLGVEPGMVEVP